MPKPQRYFFDLTIHDLEDQKDLVHISYESNYLDEVASTLRGQEISLLEIAKKRDKGRYVIVYKKGATKKNAEQMQKRVKRIGIKP